MGTFEHGPKRLNAVRVGLSTNVLSNSVLDCPMVRQSLVDSRFVRIDLGIRFRVFNHETL